MSIRTPRALALLAGASVCSFILPATICGCAARSQAPIVQSTARYQPVALAPQSANDQAAGAIQAEQPIDLTDGSTAVFGSAEPEFIDTTLIEPQIQAWENWTGEVRPIKNILPAHQRPARPPQGPANDLPVGGLHAEPRTEIDALFPTLTQTPWTPPDPTLAVGPDHVVVTVNMAIGFYSKATGALQFSQNLDSTGSPGFFESVGGGDFTFDPKCFYDHLAGRFIVVALEVYGSTQAYISIAVSDDSDPNGTWYKYRTNAVISSGGLTYWVDYPGFGYDQNAWYVTGNLFGLNNGGFGGVVFRSFRKTPMLTGGAASFADLRDSAAASVQAAQHFGTPQAAYFASIESTSSLRIHAVRNVLTTPTLTSSVVTVASFSYPSGGAPNSGGNSLDVLGDRLMNVCWRNGKLYTGHTVLSSSRNMARWYQLQTNDWPNSGSISSIMSGNVDGGTGVHTFFPAVYANRWDDVGMVVARTTSSTFPAIYSTGRKATDAAGTMGALTQAAIGTSGASGRWGDYFDIAVDPNDDSTFWLVGEYAQSGGWATWVSSFQVTTCAPPTITQQPASQNGCPGDPIGFSVSTSAASPTYQWRRGSTNLVNGANISGATTASLAILSAGPADVGTDYNCIVTAAACSTTSANASLTLGVNPVIQTQPMNETVTAGDTAVFTIATTEPSVLFTFQWKKDGVNLVDGGDIGGAQATVLAILNTDDTDEATYTCVVTRVADGCDVTSSGATLTVDPPAGCANPSGGCDRCDIFPTATPDCVVDLGDLGQLLANYAPGVGGKTRAQGDVFPTGGVGDGFVDLSDLGQMLADFGTDCR